MTQSIEDIIRLLGLRPHPEGGYFAETYRSESDLACGSSASTAFQAVGPPATVSDARPSVEPAGSGCYETESPARPLATAIYYLLTPDSFSEMHQLPGDEMFHFYLGDPVEMLQLFPSGGGAVVRIGMRLEDGERPQVLVPGGVWQGSRLLPGGRFALLGTTMSPGFDYRDYRAGSRADLVRAYPDYRDLITLLTRG